MTEAVSNQIMLYDVILNEAFIVTPYKGRKAKIDPATGQPIGKYLAKFILPETHPQLEAFRQLQRDAIAKKWPDATVAEAKKVQIGANNKAALHRGDVDRAGKEEYKGKLFISTSNSEQPTIVVTENGINIATRGTPKILTPAHPLFPYNGCRVNVHLEVFAYENEGTGVSAKCLGLQFLNHGTRLQGSSVSSASEFKPVVNDAGSPPPSTQAAQGGDGLI